LQPIGLQKDELVQALGLSFTVSTIALAINVALEGGLRLSIASDTIAGLALACAGMWIGQAIRPANVTDDIPQMVLCGLDGAWTLSGGTIPFMRPPNP